jgi:hypothetical protein
MLRWPEEQMTHYSPIAQSVEQMTVNHWVTGSSPVRGAILGDQVCLRTYQTVYVA